MFNPNVVHACPRSASVLEHVYLPKDIRIGAASLPPFHAFGVYIQLTYPVASLKSVSMFAPTSYHDPTIPPVIPTAQNTIQVVQRTKVTSLMVVPAFLEEWANSPHSVQLLSGLEYVVGLHLFLVAFLYFIFLPSSKMESLPCRFLPAHRLPRRRVMRW